LGERLECLMRERETADRVLSDARTRFEEIAPKLNLADYLSSPSYRALTIASFWDTTIDQPLEHPIAPEDCWRVLRHQHGVKEPYATVAAAAHQSGYASALERVRSIDLEIHETAPRTIDIEAASMTGVKAQALAILALDQTVYGWRGPRIHAYASTLSRAVVALSNGGQEEHA
jgi:hypothetical protein